MRVLQVEYTRDGGYRPNPSLLQGVKYETYDPSVAKVHPSFTSHANEVAKCLLKDASKVIDTIVACHQSTYGSRGVLGAGRVNSPTLAAEHQWPKEGGFNCPLENHSYGAIDVVFQDTLLERFDERIKKFNIVACVAVPNAGMGYGSMYGKKAPYGLFSQSKEGIYVGSANLGIDLLDGGRVDVVADGYTSYATPHVAATCALVMQEFINAAKAYKYTDIRDIIMSTADSMGSEQKYGAGKLNKAKAVELAKKRAGTVISTPAPIPVPTPKPPVINSFAATKASIVRGEAVTLNYSTTDADELVIEGVGSVSGTAITITPTVGTHTYKLKATNEDGSVTKTTTVSVAPNLPVITDFYVDSPTVAKGGQAYVEWDVSNATTITLNGVVVTGNNKFIPADELGVKTVTLVASNQDGNATESLTFEVVVPPAPELYVARSFYSFQYHDKAVLKKVVITRPSSVDNEPDNLVVEFVDGEGNMTYAQDYTFFTWAPGEVEKEFVLTTPPTSELFYIHVKRETDSNIAKVADIRLEVEAVS